MREWLKGVALDDPHYPGNSGGRVALVGTSYDDMRDVMVEGESGLLAIHKKSERPQWISSRKELIWDNGTVGKLFSSANPEGLRGNQFGAVWADEICKWQNLQLTWDMLQFCLRLGNNPRQVVTTTPKPLKLLKQIMKDPTTITVRSTTSENANNLAHGFLEYVEGIYSGTRLGRQELDGEIIEDNEHALWRRDGIEASRLDKTPDLKRIVIAVDPPASSGSKSASCGIIAVGLMHDGPVRPVHASRGKWIRAEPVALLYERSMVLHAGRFAELEDQMCAFTPDGMAEGVSPDRVDALVWAITELALSKRAVPRVRRA